MIDIINELTSNYIFCVSVISWFVAQVLKTIINLLVTKQLKLERLVGAGGMPSAHSAFVCSLTVATAKQCGLSSPMFAIAFALAAVVLYDAMGVRRAAGEQAKVLNQLSDLVFRNTKENYFVVKQLKELLGHTPLEVLAGAILGISIALLL